MLHNSINIYRYTVDNKSPFTLHKVPNIYLSIDLNY